MSKLKKEKLLEILRDIKLFIKSERTGWWDEKDEQAYQQMKEMIQKPEVTEEWIEEKATQLIYKWFHKWREAYTTEELRAEAKDFIRSLVEEIKKK